MEYLKKVFSLKETWFSLGIIIIFIFLSYVMKFFTANISVLTFASIVCTIGTVLGGFSFAKAVNMANKEENKKKEKYASRGSRTRK